MKARILIVEDDAMVALHLAKELTKAGFDIVGPAASVGKALALIQGKGCDAAVLDIRLGSETAELIARELLARRVPFVAATGYASEQQPSIFRGAPMLSKPISIRQLVAELQGLRRRDDRRL